MTSVDALARRVTSLKKRASKDLLPRTWCFILTSGEQFPKDVEATIQSQIRSNDLVYIRYIMVDMSLKEGDRWCWGYVHWHGGTAIIRQDGRLEKVGKR